MMYVCTFHAALSYHAPRSADKAHRVATVVEEAVGNQLVEAVRPKWRPRADYL